jgi:Topoisomerase DNA binding C4 zinc finger
MANALKEVHVACLACGHQAEVRGEILEARLGEPPTLANIAEIWPNFRCLECRGAQVTLSANGRLLLDPRNVRRCKACGVPILLPRIQIVPRTTLCEACMEASAMPQRRERYPMPPPGLDKCPSCDHPTIVRENSEDGQYFIGCTQFPSCRWTTRLPTNRLTR